MSTLPNIVKLIEKALNDELSLEEATDEMAYCSKGAPRLAQEALHAVLHYVTDADIREKDAEYNKLAKSELHRHMQRISLLESNHTKRDQSQN